MTRVDGAHRGTAVMAIKDTGAGGPAVTIGGITAWSILDDMLSDLGVRLVRLEETENLDPQTTVVLWDFGSFAVLPRRLARAAEGRIIAWSLESPLVAERAYHRVDKIASIASDLFAFPGVRSLLSRERVRFHPVLWPMDPKPISSGQSWERRGFLAMINSNKRARPFGSAIDVRDPYGSARTLAASALSHVRAAAGSWRAEDLYSERISAICHFVSRDDFSLYGVGWDALPPSLKGVNGGEFRRVYKGTVDSKQRVLERYRFALSIENTIFPGYVSEKLLDPIFAGSIPVYLGAPDITRYVPGEVFVDMRAFGSYGELEEHLRTMTCQEGEERRAAARAFVASDAFQVFSSERFAGRIAAAVKGLL